MPERQPQVAAEVPTAAARFSELKPLGSPQQHTPLPGQGLMERVSELWSEISETSRKREKSRKNRRVYFNPNFQNRSESAHE